MAEDLIKNNVATIAATETPDPRTFLVFKTLAKFEEKLASGRVDPNKHFVAILDERLWWVRGNLISDNGKLDDFDSYYNDWELVQNNGTTIDITLKGNEWNSVDRIWEAISKKFTINSATQSIAGLQSAADKLKEDRITRTNHTISNTSTADERTIKLTAINPTDNSDASTSTTIPSATQTDAGVLTATDKKAIDNLHSGSWSHINDTNTFTSTTTDVNLNYTCRQTDMNSASASETHSLPIGAVSSTRAGVMIAQDKIELDRINTTNFELTGITPNASTVTINTNRLNINTNVEGNTDLTIPAATGTKAGVMTSTDKTELDRIDTANFDITAVTPSETTVTVSATKTNITDGSSVDDTFVIPESTTTKAGTASAQDKITSTNVRTIKDVTHVKDTAFTASATGVTLNYENISSSTKDATVVAKNPAIPMSSATSAGLITAAESIALNTTLPEAIAKETQDRKDAIDALDVTDSVVTGKIVVKVEETDGKVSNTKEFIKNIALTEYTSTGESGSLLIAASDTVEGAFNKVETYIKGLDVSNTITSGEYITSLSETNGKIAYNKANVSSSPLNVYTKGTDGSAVKATDTINQAVSKLENQIDIEAQSRKDAINGLDVDPIGTTGQYIYEVSETDGKIDAKYKLAEAKEVKNESTKSQISSSTTVQAALDALSDVATKQRVTAADKSLVITEAASGTTAKVNIKTGEHNLKLDTTNGLYTDIKIHKLDTPESGENVLEEYELLSSDNTRLGTTIKIYKDSSLQSVKLNGQQLEFTYILADGTTEMVPVDMSVFLTENEYADGLQVNNHIISVKRDTSSESFLTVSVDGIKLAGVQNAINTAKNAVQSNLDLEIADRKAAIEALDYTDKPADNEFVTEVSETDGVIEVKRARPTASNVSNTAITASTTQVGLAGTNVQTTIGNIATAIKTEETRAIAKENAIESALDTYKTSNDKALADEIARAKGEEKTLTDNLAQEIKDRQTAINTAIQSLDSSISAEASKYISSVTITDGKISAHDKANVSDATLIGYSKGTATTAVAAGDTVKAAMAKLENQIDAERTRATNAEEALNSSLSSTFSFKTITGNSGTASAEIVGDTLAINGGTDISTAVTDTSNNDTVTINHKSVSRSDTNTTNSTTVTIPANGTELKLKDAVTAITSSTTGHITAVTKENITVLHGSTTRTNTDTATSTTTIPSDGTAASITRMIKTVNSDNGHITGTVSEQVSLKHGDTTRSAETSAVNTTTTTIPADGTAVNTPAVLNSVSSNTQGHVTASAKTQLPLAHGTVTHTPGTGAIVTAITTSNGHVTADTRGNLSGDVTTNNSLATTIANNKVTNAKLADMPANTIKGNNTSDSADPKDLTVSEVKTMLSLNNVNNTSDANKPISTATQTALNTKVDEVEKTGSGNAFTDAKIEGTKLTLTKGTTFAPLASPALTGTPTAPTATAGTNTTQIATTAFVKTAVSNAIDNLIDGASTAMDTFAEIEQAFKDNDEVIDALDEAIAKKVDKSSVSGANPTLAWGTTSTVGTIDGKDFKVTMPANPNTDERVTSVTNHYKGTITETNNTTNLNATGTGNARKVVTGVEYDAAGHITKVTTDPIYSTDTNTKVTSVGNHYTPTGTDTISASGGTATNATGSGSAQLVITGVTIDAAGHITGVTSKGIYSTDTDTKVTSAANHYAPSSETYTPTSGSAVGWSGTVITGITKDSKGHIVEVTTGAIPANPVSSTTVTGSSLTIDTIVVGNGNSAVKSSSKTFATSMETTNDTTIPTSKAVKEFVESKGYTSNTGTVTGVKINGTTKNPSSGVVDLGDVITSLPDGSITGTPGASKTFTAFSQTNGKVTATVGDISITKSQVSGLGAAAEKGVDTSITASSTSTNLPTSKAVADLVSGKADKVSITQGNTGDDTATSGATISVPYINVNSLGLVTGYGNRTHTVTGFTNNTGTVTQVKVGTTAYNPSNGVVTLPEYPSVPENIQAVPKRVRLATPASGNIAIDGTEYDVYVFNVIGNISGITMSSYPEVGHECTVILRSSPNYALANGGEFTVVIANNTSLFRTPTGEDLEITIPINGYAEVNFLYDGANIWVRGV